MAKDTNEDAIRVYKEILAAIIDNRPSGTRQRLADALGKHRSFVTQITSPAYSTPLPARHLPAIFRVCHVSKNEQDRFLAAYQTAHPGKLPETSLSGGQRHLSLTVPDLGSETRNRQLDEAVGEFIQKMAALLKRQD